jgi:hypothetical protein
VQSSLNIFFSVQYVSAKEQINSAATVIWLTCIRGVGGGRRGRGALFESTDVDPPSILSAAKMNIFPSGPSIFINHLNFIVFVEVMTARANGKVLSKMTSNPFQITKYANYKQYYH